MKKCNYSKMFVTASALLAFVILLASVIPVFASSYGIDEKYSDKITYRLKEQIDKQSNEKIPVLIWLSDIDMTEVESETLSKLNFPNSEEFLLQEDIETEDIQLYIESKRECATNHYNSHNLEIAEELGIEDELIYISKYSPVLLAELNATSIKKSLTNDKIIYIDCYYEDNTSELTIANAVTRVNTVQSTYGYDGTGVKIGVFEVNMISASFPNINIAGQSGTIGTYSSHANSVLEIVSSVAPGATYYIADSSVMTNMEAIEWLLGKGVNVITASRAIGGDGLNTYGSMSQWLDHISYNHDVHFVKSAGNSGTSGVTSGGMAYNIVTVGNIDDRRTTSYADDIIHSTSSRYSGNGLAYKPDICAPGTGLVTSFSTSFTGTSAAAPQVAGTIALLCQDNATLKTRQDAVKAILTASVNTSSPRKYVPSNSNYRTYGSGLLDSYGAVYVAEQIHYKAASISKTTETKTYTINITNTNKPVRVSLAYIINSNITGSTHSSSTPTITSLANLDLEVYAPGSTTPLVTSTTLYNNVEIVEFTPAVTGTYQIVIKNNGASATTYFGLAWSW